MTRERLSSFGGATTNSNPRLVGSIVTNEIVPSSFLRDAAVLLHSADVEDDRASLLAHVEGPERRVPVMGSELCPPPRRPAEPVVLARAALGQAEQVEVLRSQVRRRTPGERLRAGDVPLGEGAHRIVRRQPARRLPRLVLVAKKRREEALLPRVSAGRAGLGDREERQRLSEDRIASSSWS
jgi:hypothetical protein